MAGWLEQQENDKKTEYQAIKAKIAQLTGTAHKHSLNDGQIDQKVENWDLDKLYERLAMLENEIATSEGDIQSAVYLY